MNPATALHINSAYGYRGGRICFADNDVVLFICGNGIKTLNLKSGDQRFTWGQASGISAIATEPKSGLVAYASRGGAPKIYVLSYPRMEVLAALNGGTEIEYRDLAFSRDGTRLVSVGSEPDFTLTVWNWEKESVLVKTALLEGDYADRVSFNPRNNNQLCTSGPNLLSVWNVDKTYEHYTIIRSEVGDITPATGGAPISAGLVFPVHVWTADNTLYCGARTGELVCVDIATMRGTLVDPHVESDGGITTLVLVRDHVITGGGDGVLRWYSLASHEIKQLLEVKRGSTLLAVSVSPRYTSLAVASASGMLHTVSDLASGSPRLEEAGHFHVGPVAGVACFPQQHVMATVGRDGTLRLINYTTLFCFAQLNLRVPLTAVACCPTLPFLAVGSAHGVVRIYDVSKLERPRLVYRLKLHEGALSHLRFDATGNVLATGGADEKVYLLDTSVPALDTMHIQGRNVLGYVAIKGRVVGLTWAAPDAKAAPAPSQVFIACHTGDVYRCDVPRGRVKTEKYRFVNRADIKKSLLKADFPVHSIEMMPKSISNRRQAFYALSHDRRLKWYVMPEETGDPEFMDESDITPAQAEWEAHFKRGGAIAVTPDGKWLASGGADGRIVLRPTLNLGNSFAVGQHDPGLGGVAAMCFSFDSQYLFSAGHDGAIFVSTLSYAGWERLNEVEADGQTVSKAVGVNEASAPETATDPTLLVMEERAVAEAEDSIHEASREQMAKRVTTIQDRFTALLNANIKAPQLERLDRGEFTIDVAAVDMLRAEGELRATKAKEDITLENVAREYVADAIKRECWDSMESTGMRLTAFNMPMQVYSYPLRKPAEDEVRRVAKIKAMRRIEAKEAKMRKADEAAQRKAEAERAEKEKKGEEDAHRNPLNRLRQPERRRRGSISVTALSSPGEIPAQEEESDEETGEEDVYMLYDEFELHTPSRKRTQVVLLQTVIYDIKDSFNKQFQAALKQKHEEIASIEEKNEKIAAIVAELQSNHPIFHPHLDALETPETVLTVLDSEVPAEKFVAPSEVARLAEARAREEERLRREKGDDSGERALKMMMGGRLEDRETAGLNVELTRPEWMSKPVDKMTEDEVKQLKEFEKKEQARHEEREKQRRSLETSLKRLEGGVAAQCAKFDEEKMVPLMNMRIAADQAIYENELKIVEYSLAAYADEEAERKEYEINARLKQLKEEETRVTEEVNDFAREVDAVKERFEVAKTEEARLVKEFKKTLLEQYEPFRDTLYKLYTRRRKPPPPRAPDADSLARDPFAAFDAEIAPPMQRLDDSLDARDRPEGMDLAGWERVLAARNVKIQVETEKEHFSTLWQEMKKYRDRLNEQANALRTQSYNLLAEKEAFTEQRRLDAVNMDVLLKLKQGFVETGEAPVVANRGDYILMDIREIQRLNTDIRALGGGKMQLLDEIKKCRKEIHFLNWENQVLDLDAQVEADTIKDFQLLRVTKKLQELIKDKGGKGGGGAVEDRRVTENATLTRRLQHAEETHVAKITEKRAVLNKYSKLVAQKEAENAQLEAHVAELELSVAERSRIHKIQSQNEAQQGPERKMKVVAQRRVLVESAKAQADEIASLREELERLRLRTFPAFPATNKR